MLLKLRLFLIRLLAGKSLDQEFEDVFIFHKKFGQLAHREVGHLTRRAAHDRYKFMFEELQEFREAVEVQNMAKMADALIDLVYVAKGTAVKMGLPWRQLWDDVQRANLAKVVGMTHRGGLVDVKKPEGWVPPKTEEILEVAGYYEEDWKFPGNDFCYAGVARDYAAYDHQRRGNKDPEYLTRLAQYEEAA